MNPALSIIIPCYNCERTLKEAVDSCFRQGLTELFEIIMVDDCSTDNTRNVMVEISKEHKETRLFYHSENKGGGATRNTAVYNSRSEIIFCLDSDDFLGDFTLRKMLDFQKTKKCDGLGISTSIKFNGRNRDDISYVNKFGFIGQIIPFESLFETDKNSMCSLFSTFLITKSAFNKIGGYPTYHGFDTQGIAFRFLAAGLIAYTCPDTIYFHRVNFHKSYYLREYESGKVNLNWRYILEEFIYLFNNETKELILNFNINSEKNILSKIIGSGDFLVENHNELLMTRESIYEIAKKRSDDMYWQFWLGNIEYINRNFTEAVKYFKNSILIGNDTSSTKFKLLSAENGGNIANKNIYPNDLLIQNIPYKKYGSSMPLAIRLFKKILNIMMQNDIIHNILLQFYVLINKIVLVMKEFNNYKAYQLEIKNIINKEYEFVLDIPYGGIGDWLTYTSLPRLLKERYNIDFYISDQSINRLRNKDTFKICFELNPYFKGIKKDTKIFRFKTFIREQNLWQFLTDKNGLSYTEIIEKQFDISDKGIPEIYYEPKIINELSHTILIDKNYISGKKFGWKFRNNIFENKAREIMITGDRIDYINPKKQSLFDFVDMIYSCKCYIGTSSGGASLAACFDKPFYVILPYNSLNGSVFGFCYRNSKGKYVSR